ncbi:DUF4442 domain-containing protein [Halobacterium litoreum]|uniref:DUF4442 domain-containing protein n=1 Tax=Halobacterium litoreum TaxID=2039234 RepID=A0ABD5NEX6_9EURY|nr:DUF4442 domain-containing protein [Halobacterium litoreum]UHH13402.1 DUF4442 domain-containing protein [Halobacterium litoreum]
MLPSFDAVRARLYRLGFSYFPAYWTTGAKIVALAPDFSYARVKLPLNWRTKNVVGTTFGGSIYGAVDPVYMVLLRQRLGDDFTVWDSAATIDYREPGESTLYAKFEVSDADVRRFRELAPGESTERTYDVPVVDADGTVHADVEKTLYVRRDA